MAQMGTGAVKGPYDPTKKESSRFNYFQAVQADLNAQANKSKNKTKAQGKVR